MPRRPGVRTSSALAGYPFAFFLQRQCTRPRFFHRAASVTSCGRQLSLHFVSATITDYIYTQQPFLLTEERLLTLNLNGFRQTQYYP